MGKPGASSGTGSSRVLIQWNTVNIGRDRDAGLQRQSGGGRSRALGFHAGGGASQTHPACVDDSNQKRAHNESGNLILGIIRRGEIRC